MWSLGWSCSGRRRLFGFFNAEALAYAAGRVFFFLFNVGVEHVLVVVQHDLVEEQVLQLLATQIVQLEVEVVWRQFVSFGLVIRVVQVLKVRML